MASSAANMVPWAVGVETRVQVEGHAFLPGEDNTLVMNDIAPAISRDGTPILLGRDLRGT